MSKARLCSERRQNLDKNKQKKKKKRREREREREKTFQKYIEIAKVKISVNTFYKKIVVVQLELYIPDCYQLLFPCFTGPSYGFSIKKKKKIKNNPYI